MTAGGGEEGLPVGADGRQGVGQDRGGGGLAPVGEGHRPTPDIEPDDDLTQASPHVPEGGRQGQDRHHLRCRGDVEGGLPGNTVLGGAQSDDDVAEGAVVDVEYPPPGDGMEVQLQLVAVMEMIVDDGGQGVVGGRDGVDVARQVEVERLERPGLAVAASRRATLDAEGGSHRGLADGGRGALADVLEPLCQSDGGGRLALPQGRRGDGGHDDVPGPRPVGQRADGIERDLGDVAAVGLEEVLTDPHAGGHLRDGQERGPACDLERGQRRGVGHQLSSGRPGTSPTAGNGAARTVTRPGRPVIGPPPGGGTATVVP